MTKLLKDLEWPTLQRRRMEARLINFYKNMNRDIALEFPPQIQPKQRATRSYHTKSVIQLSCRTNLYHIKLCFVVLKAWVEKQYKLSNLVSLSAGLGQRRSINRQNGGLGYLVFGCPLTSFALR